VKTLHFYATQSQRKRFIRMNTEQNSMGFYLRDRGIGAVGFSSLLAKVSTDFHSGTLDSYFQMFIIV
jgi:hypothetical protein